MSLDVPDLDDRRFEELMEDLRKRIPVHDDAWTDHNAHDPGITILELLAWLAESYGYQLDQVTDAHLHKYADLVGATPRPPRRATVRLALSAGDGLDGRELPAGTPVLAEEAPGETEPFETTGSLTLTAASVADVVSEHPDGRTDHSREQADEGRQYRAFGAEAGPDCALYLGFDGDPFAGGALDLFVDFHEEDLPAPAGADAPGRSIEADGTGGGTDAEGPTDGGIETYAVRDTAFRPSIAVDWQYCTNPDSWYEESAWADLEVAVDRTMAFYRGGRVRLERPDGWTEGRTGPATILGREPARYWLRCVTRARAGEDERYEVPPRLDAVRTNVVGAAHRESTDAAELTREDGAGTTAEPGQRFAFPSGRAPAHAASVSVGGEPWTEVEDFDASGPTDRHYVLDPAAGEVRFGDGRRGAIPGPGQPVLAHDVVYGGGPAGNVPAGADWQITADRFRGVDAAALSPPEGGREAEPIEETLARAIEERSVAHRAVTAADYRDLATRTPGLRVARAAALVGGSGPVRLVVVPYSPPPVERPVPTSGFLDAVERFVGERLLLTEQVRVLAPQYVPVDVTAEVHLAGDAGVEPERRAAERDIESFLDPLRGFEGDGWPFGRPVYESELYEVLESRDGIDSVVDVQVTTGGEVPLGDTDGALPYPDEVSVVARSEGARCGGDR